MRFRSSPCAPASSSNDEESVPKLSPSNGTGGLSTLFLRARSKRGMGILLFVLSLWVATLGIGISTASSTYSLFGELVVNALGVQSMDIQVTGSDEEDWSPEEAAESVWEQATERPYVVDFPKSGRLLTQGTTLWSNVAVKNASEDVAVSVQVTLRDDYASSTDEIAGSSEQENASPAPLNLFTVSRFSLICDGVTLASSVVGTDTAGLSNLVLPRVLAAGEIALCRIGVSLDDAAFDEGLAMTTESRVVPQLLFEGEQR
ncbi:MAG: hypothetical protein ABF489_04715 [Bifidobacterium sp.]|uniref:hypothetical protein n=1 Tax=Bifidobacterium sp. TaxID=41200 RepID=UPI0039ED8260